MKLHVAVALVALLGSAHLAQAEDGPMFPQPTDEHRWLQQMVGEWETHAVAAAKPGDTPFECRGQETVRSIGGFWTVGETKGEPMGMPMHGVLTLGYNIDKKKFVGSWIDSMTSHQWTYEGTLDKKANTLTLLTEGPSMLEPGKTAKFKEVMEIKDKDNRVFTSQIQGEDGAWLPMVTITYTRKK
mgnify:CR=1 FL=1